MTGVTDYGGVSRLTFMLKRGDEARVDAMLTADRTYYRFVTDDSAEDGDLPGAGDQFPTWIKELLDCFKPAVGVTGDIKPLEFKLFVNNVAVTPTALNGDTLMRFAEVLASRHDEFGFVVSLIG